MSVYSIADVHVTEWFEGMDAVARAVVADAVLADSTEHVPERTGALKGSGKVEGDGEAVVWPKEYAAPVYFGTDRMAPRPWFERARAESWGDWAALAADAIGGKL